VCLYTHTEAGGVWCILQSDWRAEEINRLAVVVAPGGDKYPDRALLHPALNAYNNCNNNVCVSVYECVLDEKLITGARPFIPQHCSSKCFLRVSRENSTRLSRSTMLSSVFITFSLRLLIILLGNWWLSYSVINYVILFYVYRVRVARRDLRWSERDAR
jgi:hypothetical protein